MSAAEGLTKETCSLLALRVMQAFGRKEFSAELVGDILSDLAELERRRAAPPPAPASGAGMSPAIAELFGRALYYIRNAQTAGSRDLAMDIEAALNKNMGTERRRDGDKPLPFRLPVRVGKDHDFTRCIIDARQFRVNLEDIVAALNSSAKEGK